MVISICLLFLILSLVISKAFTGTVLTPLGIFGSVWNIFLIFFELRLVEYIPVSADAYLLLIGSYAVFLLGAITILLGTKLNSREPVLISLKMQSLKPMCNLTILYHLIRIYGVVSASGVAMWIYTVNAN